MKSSTKLTLLVLATVTTAATLQIASATPDYRLLDPVCLSSTRVTASHLQERKHIPAGTEASNASTCRTGR